MKSQNLLVLFMLLITRFSGMAQHGPNNIFSWIDGLTTYRGTIDTKHYSLSEVENIYRCLYNPMPEAFTVDAIWNMVQAQEAETKKLDAYFSDYLAQLDSLNLKPGSYWDSLRIARTLEITSDIQSGF